jgi:copper chaperone
MAQTQDMVLSVPEIHCEKCEQAINGSLGKLSGVQSVSTDVPTKTVRLKYDPGQISMAQIEATLDDQGYTVAK